MSTAHHTAGAADRIPARAPAGGTTALLFATAAADDGGPACALAFEDGTLLSRLVDQLASLGVHDVRVVTRRRFASAVERALEGRRAELVTSDSLADDLALAAQTARTAGGRVVVGLADVVAHREAFAGLLADPRPQSSILATAGWLGRPYTFKIRSRRGRVVSAGSPFHVVHEGNHRFLGMVKVAPADLDAFAEAAERLAQITDGGVPAEWVEQLGERPARWRQWLAEVADHPADDPPPDPPEDEPADVPPGLALGEAEEDEIALRGIAATEDATALLVVGLVRSGAFVVNSFVRRLYWDRPLSQGAADDARERMTAYDEDKVLLDSAVKAADGFFTTFFVSPYSKYIARWAARRGFTPNQVTTVSVLIGLAAAAAFATGERWGLIAGAVLLQAAFTTDCVDGQLARYTRTFTKLGAWLDSIFDRTKEYLVFAGLAIGAGNGGDPAWLLAGAALTLQTARHTMEFSWGATMQQQMAAVTHPPLEQPRDQAALRPRAAASSAPARRSPRRGLASVVARWTSLDTLPKALWVKRIIAFPIGERFAVISLMAALTTPRTTLIVVLACNGFAATYSCTGRLLRSITQ